MNTTEMIETPQELWNLIRKDEYLKSTAGVALGYLQTNLVPLPQEYAFDFLLFCQRNPKPCPILEVMEPGEFEPKILAKGADIRTDVPFYRIYENGELKSETKNILDYWQDDLVSFLIGCSFTFETAMLNADIPLRHIEQDTTVPMYITNIDTKPAGKFSGPTVVSMRPIHKENLVRAVQVTSRFPGTHGAPIHIGEPGEIGIQDINTPDFGEKSEIKDNEIPVFWACGVTPQAVALKSKPPIMITHSPGYMFVTSTRDESVAVI
ncbi:MAG: DUF1445 domain-containing protein [Chloroflexi bacterium]|nr:DUF1445 domain-containing protein [Chloroflexota bacterium]